MYNIMDIKISFIIPVYNVEKYISKCVESVLNQNYSNIEVILIDDGSTDNSPFICDKYERLDTRVKVIHKKNGGLSSARNVGINMATGDYICFLDSDDFWIEDKLESIVKQILKNKCDLLLFPMVSYYEEKDIYTPFSVKFEDINISNDCSKNLIGILKQDPTFGWCAVRYIIKKEFVKNKMYFKEGYLCEDVEFIFKLWNSIRKVDYFNEDVYAYRRDNENSITHVASFKFCNDLLYMIKKNLEYFNKYEINEELKNLLYINFQNLVGVVLYWYSMYDKDERRKLENEIKKIKYIFKLDKEYRNNKINKTKIINLFLSTIGINITGVIWGMKRQLSKKYFK